MKKVQFFTNGEVTTYLDQYSRTYLEEQSQLLNQGFLTIGEVVEAEDVAEAFHIHHQSYGNEFKEMSFLSILGGVAAAI
ncbi:hypothetical protein [Endozoicomonas arenosclerae]|uniref:hypothetical protein n=1 Tax=Endozoicomonas arenosclerae TaxID=1633495 RepID=UPI0007845D22|nr:hypothetical protein [Endozoicomonas arenosclerae]